MKEKIKEELKKAYESGIESVKFNKQVDDLLEKGTKQSPEKQNFENWYQNMYEEEKESNALFFEYLKGKL